MGGIRKEVLYKQSNSNNPYKQFMTSHPYVFHSRGKRQGIIRVDFLLGLCIGFREHAVTIFLVSKTPGSMEKTVFEKTI